MNLLLDYICICLMRTILLSLISHQFIQLTSRMVDLYELSMPSLLYRIKSITSRDAVKPDFPVGLSRSTVNFDTGADLLARYFKHIID